MSYINNQSKDLYSIEFVQDLDEEASAAISGGLLFLFDQPNPQGDQVVLTVADPNLESFNNKASSYRIMGNNNWYAYTGKNYTGTRYVLKAGTTGKFTGKANNNIESAKPAY